jgi:hypothetical protein
MTFVDIIIIFMKYKLDIRNAIFFFFLVECISKYTLKRNNLLNELPLSFPKYSILYFSIIHAFVIPSFF